MLANLDGLSNYSRVELDSETGDFAYSQNKIIERAKEKRPPRRTGSSLLDSGRIALPVGHGFGLSDGALLIIAERASQLSRSQAPIQGAGETGRDFGPL